MKNLKRLWNIIVAILYCPIFKLFHKKNDVILIGGHEGKVYEDNSKHMYEYYLKNDGNVYWVMNKEADWNRIPGKFVFRGSVLNYLLYFNAKVVLYSHSKSDALPLIHRFYSKKETVHVFLGHGPDGLKKQKKTSKESLISKLFFETYNVPQADIYIALSEFEKNIKHKQWGIPSEKIRVTGLPRFDTLVDDTLASINSDIDVLYMPTWREWFDGQSIDRIKKSPLISDLVQLLSTKKYNDVLGEFNIKINIFGHIFLQDTLKEVLGNQYKSIQNVRFLSNKKDVQTLMREANILVTDYSSVSFDFLYLNKPIIFFQPDKEKYLIDRGSYIDLDNELFGLKARTIDELIEHLLWLSNKENFTQCVDHEELYRQKYFTFFDHSNCIRVDEAINNYRKND